MRIHFNPLNFKYYILVSSLIINSCISNDTGDDVKPFDPAAQAVTDSLLIQDYIDRNNIAAQPTASGLWYVLTEETQGDNPSQGDLVAVNYVGYTLDAQVFDTSFEDVAQANQIHNSQRVYEPLQFELGAGQVIQGWDEGISLMRVNEKVTLFIPSVLAYGPTGINGFFINEVLAFDVELVEIIE